MFSGEGDFDLCMRAINDQVGVNMTHVIIENLSEHEAANRLYTMWESVKGEYDMFVQVDADTVLTHPYVVLSMYETLLASPKHTAIQAPLHDYLTNSSIMGLNGYLPKVVWRPNALNKLYTDRCHEGNVTLIVNGSPQTLVPAGRHAWNPTSMQAYRFGLHRGLKNQHGTFEKVREAFKRDRTVSRGFALLGFRDALELHMRSNFNYNDPEFIEMFKDAERCYHRRVSELA